MANQEQLAILKQGVDDGRPSGPSPFQQLRMGEGG
jgi:hypothetical protein